MDATVTPEATVLARPAPGARFARRHLWVQLSVTLLLFAVAGFSTVAKDSQYLPSSHPAHYLNISSKMKVSPPSVALDRAPLQAVAKVVPLLLVVRQPHHEEQPPPAIESIGLCMALQFRPPPAVSL